jgi:AcrR family transcriptional regulator
MKIRETRREAAIERMADHLLEQGMAGASLRPLAKAAGTSDRMLVYYFETREALLAVTLERVATRLRATLDAALPVGERLPSAALLAALWTVVGSPALQPFMRLWIELAAAAVARREPELSVAGAILDGFAAWISARLEGEPGPAHDRAAASLFATLEGALLFNAVGRREFAEEAIPLA